MINYGRQYIDNTDIKEVTKVLKSDYLTQGPLVKKFEKELSKKFKSKYASVVSNGSAALFLIGKILKWKKGDLVAVPPITFISSVNSIEHCGASPLFVDISLRNYCMDPIKLEEALKKDKKKKIKAAIVTDYGGQPAEWEKFVILRNKYNIKLINDCCHSMGSAIKKNEGYASKFADFVSLSFHPVKAITTGEGGAILLNNKKHDNEIKLLRSHGISRKKDIFWKYTVSSLGYNFRLPDLNCALGISQLKKIDKFVKKRKEVSRIYDNFFKDKEKFIIPKKNNNKTSSYHLYPLLVNFNKIKKTKDKVIKEFYRHGIKLQVHYIPVNLQPYYIKKYGIKKNNFKNSLFFFDRVISLPIYYDLTNKDLNHVQKICKKIFNI
ncbi:dTDP-4-amino-4,6-dideoxygalactose transaminase [Candidatus Pelagibacter ubique]|uniref:dTDP-4-amino-4,6-dideoxygalactose transaminase n=1 Tax=Pelagibacter ubique TaxID=198252 RepID=A0ABX1T0V7_PELUQ|nr:aminotransferase class I/II-fold pyridoxal phosphate-dependent enzyme [Candidatus Pelagibacter ubique]NMN67074.1 dTDP-4-amino-4,6-dideoxygalactose transaminase [Candidatus Pelagibacter ubique]